jgi:hypothetical protein
MEMDNILQQLVSFYWVQHIDPIQCLFGFIEHHQQLEMEQSFISQLCKKKIKLIIDINSCLRNKNYCRSSLLYECSLVISFVIMLFCFVDIDQLD